MLAQEFIRRKRDGKELAPADIAEFIAGLTTGSVSEGQAAAFAIGPLTGLLVNQLQVTSLISVIGVMDLTKVGNILNLRTLKPFVVWTVVGALYYLTAKLVAYAGGRFEKQLRAHTKWKGL